MKTSRLRLVLKSITIALIIGSCFSAFGQFRDLEITYKRNADNSVDFFFTKNTIGSSTIVMRFKNLRNAFHTGRPQVVKGIRGKVLSLKPTEPNKRISFSYSYMYTIGAIKPKVKEDFVYLLPFKDGTKLKVIEVKNLGKTLLGREEPKDWKMYKFESNADTVYAVRKGIVLKVQSDHSLSDNTLYSRKGNRIMIEHPDGTLSAYTGFGKNGALVKEGDMVYPHTPIAILSEGGIKGNLTFSLNFLLDIKISDDKSSGKNIYQYLNPIFSTQGGEKQLEGREEYIVKIEEEIITKEMTKREKKKRAKK